MCACGARGMEHSSGDVLSTRLSGAFQVDESRVQTHLDQKLWQVVEQTLNGMLVGQTDQLWQASRYERSPERADTRAGESNVPRRSSPRFRLRLGKTLLPDTMRFSLFTDVKRSTPWPNESTPSRLPMKPVAGT
jgi:hypothetical protein